jgi:hypothetical protein
MGSIGAIATYGLTIPLLLIPMTLMLFMPGKPSALPIGENIDEHIPFEESSSESGGFRKVYNTAIQWCSRAQSHVRTDVLPMLESTVIVRGLIGMLTVSFGECVSLILMQYLHVRFKWKYEEVSWTDNQKC